MPVYNVVVKVVVLVDANNGEEAQRKADEHWESQGECVYRDKDVAPFESEPLAPGTPVIR
jgi:hypothetical protein